MGDNQPKALNAYTHNPWAQTIGAESLGWGRGARRGLERTTGGEEREHMYYFRQ